MSNMRSYDLRGHLEAVMALEAIMAPEAVMASEAIGGNMLMDTRVIIVADVKSEVIWRLPWPQRPLEAICTWRPG